MMTSMRALKIILAAAFLILLIVPACSQTTEPGALAGCTGDGDCPPGEECAGGGCVPSPPPLYPNIQLASVLFRNVLDDGEVNWRAAHNDLLIGMAPDRVDMTRAANRNIKVFGYLNVRQHASVDEVESWAAAHGYDPEDFFLHYQRDMVVGGYESVVLVDGYGPGVVPGWNPDPSPSDPPASATEKKQSRVPGRAVHVEDPWYMVNIENPGCRQFMQERAAVIVDGSEYGFEYAEGPLDGILTDVALYYPMFNEGFINMTCEYHDVPLDDNHPYALAFATFEPELQRALNARFTGSVDVMPNFGHVFWLFYPNPLAEYVKDAMDWFWGEVWITFYDTNGPYKGPDRTVTYEADYENSIANVVRQTRRGDRIVLGAQDLSADTDRGKLFTLALYYLVHNRNTYYSYQTVSSHQKVEPLQEWQWNPAVQYDIGAPAAVPAGVSDFDGRTGTTEHYVFASGPDPYDSTLTYSVLARNFTKGIVLAKMMPMGSVADAQSATTHPLDGTYYPLRSDGTLGQPVTQVILRNNEGAILIRSSMVSP
jgi:hypothetical protein